MLYSVVAAALLALPTSSRSEERTCCDGPWLCATPQLSGDWLGLRPRLVDSGVTVWADNTSFLIGNANGGLRQDLAYGGHGDYVLKFDCGKLGLPEGMFVKLRAEHRFGETITSDVGCFISPTLIADLPVFGSEQVYLTNVLFTQLLGDNLAVFAGKMDTLDGDMNAFAHGRGKTQFSNMAFVFNPIVGATVPYSTLGAGFVVLRDGESLFTFSVLNSTDTTNTSGFEQLFNDGVLLSAALRFPTQLWGLPGHHLLGATWNNQTYQSISESYIEYPDVAIPTTRGSWCMYWNFDQYVVVDAEEPLRGWGPFGRAGVADENTSPLAWFLSFGIGGSAPSPSRPADTFGIGWYYAGTSPQIGPLITAQFGPIGNGQGIECFYNYQWTPAIRLTPDLQFLVGALKNIDPSLIVGLRAQLSF
ncbi:MAG: carbohydrate porin [Pirellulales bacterium]